MSGPFKNRIVEAGSVAPGDVEAHPRNWRRHPRAQRAAVRALLEEVGWVGQVTINRRTGRLIDGGLRLELARDSGETNLPVTYVDLSEDEERLMLATLDPVSAMAEADAGQWARLIADLAPVDEVLVGLLDGITAGVAGGAVRDLLDPGPNPLAAADTTVTRTGDLWLLGPHRLLCGDATSGDDVTRLFADESPGWMWTDPPYGVDYVGKTADALTIANDRPAGLAVLLDQAFAHAHRVLHPRSPIFVAHPAGEHSVVFGAAFVGAGWHLHETLVWVKDTFVLGHSNYHYRHESILYGWKGARPAWFGGRAADTVFEIARPRRSAEHPAVKPVELVERHLLDNTRPGRLGYDPFAGAGTTLIAAERTGRRCHGIEILPGYVDLIVRRWEETTGQQAVLKGGDSTFAEVRAARHGG